MEDVKSDKIFKYTKKCQVIFFQIVAVSFVLCPRVEMCNYENFCSVVLQQKHFFKDPSFPGN